MKYHNLALVINLNALRNTANASGGHMTFSLPYILTCALTDYGQALIVVSHQVLALVPEGDYALPVDHNGVCKKTEAPGEYACKLYGT